MLVYMLIPILGTLQSFGEFRNEGPCYGEVCYGVMPTYFSATHLAQDRSIIWTCTILIVLLVAVPY